VVHSEEVSSRPRPRLTVLGSALIELFAPQAGQRLGDVEALSMEPSGSATILATVAARLGADVQLIGAVGDDELGGIWRRRVGAAGVGVGLIEVVRGQLTPIAISTVDIAGEKSYSFYRFLGSCDPLAELRLSAAQETAALNADALIVTEAVLRDGRLRGEVAAWMNRRRADGKLTVLAVNYRQAAWPSVDNAATTLAWFGSRASLVCCNHAEYELLASAGLATELVYETLGAAGVKLRHAGGTAVVPAAMPPGGVVLDTGAGDSFCGAVVVALTEGHSPAEAAAFAAGVSALAISRVGTSAAAPFRAEVEAFLGSARN
jgi:ribokinase